MQRMSNQVKNMRALLLMLFAALSLSVSAQTITVSGNVKDTAGEPIIGASVVEKGNTSNGTITDLDGNFTLKVPSKATVTISYIGMRTQDIELKGKTNINVTLEDDAQALDEVVVIGYGTVAKRDLTGSVASVSAKQIAAVPVSSASEALQGKMAGVQITTTEGSPDAEIKIRVRGGGSLSQDNSPLYIVDGFPVSSISDIAPTDIQSVDVLKDASSTAIYGAQGANGVIIITTKSGKEGKTEVSFGASYGIRNVTKMVDVLNPYEFALWQHEIQPTSYTYGAYEDLEIYKSVKGNDYQEELFGRTGNQQNYNVSVNGGTKELKYSVSYAHNDEKSIMLGSGFTKDNINAKINSTINKWLIFDFNARFSYQTIDGLAGGADSNQSNKAYSAVARSAIFRPVPAISGSGDDDDENVVSYYTPVEQTNATYKKQARFQQNYNAGLSWNPFKGWKFRSEFGYGYRYNNTDQVWDYQATASSKLGMPGFPQAQMTRVITNNWRLANTVSYDNDKLMNGDLRLGVMLGQEMKSSQDKRTIYSAVGYEVGTKVDEILAAMGNGTPQPINTYIGIKDNMSSFFGRFNATLQDKYLLSLTMRADGSSKFAEGNRWGYFPSAALAWRINEEEWMKGTENWLSNLKLRLSYGTAGNNRIDPKYMYTTYALRSSVSNSIYFGETYGETKILEHGDILSNAALKWETTYTRNLGIDFGFWNNRLSGTFDLYWNTTKDLLMRTTLPTATGYSYQYKNFGQTSNKGIELTLDASLVSSKNFNLNFNFNIAYNRGKIDSMNGMNGYYESSSTWSGNDIGCNNDFYIEEGGRLGEVYGYVYDGYYTTNDLYYDTADRSWKTRDGVINSSSMTGGNLTLGGIKLVDQLTEDTDGDGIPDQGDGVINEKDKVRLGNTIHPVNGGFGLNGNWKNFDFNIFCNYSLGGKVINHTKLRSSFYSGSSNNWNLNDDFTLANRYSNIDPVTGERMTDRTYIDNYLANGNTLEDLYGYMNEVNAGKALYNPAAVTTAPLTQLAVENGSFLRINTVSIGYTLPQTLTSKWLIKNIRLYVTGYNLFVFTKYSGADPEVDSATSTPLTPGVDYASYPKSRSFVGGVNLTF